MVPPPSLCPQPIYIYKKRLACVCLTVCRVNRNIVFLVNPAKIRKEEVHREETAAENRPESKGIHDAFVLPTSYQKQQQC